MIFLTKQKFFLWAWGLLLLSLSACGRTDGNVSPDDGPHPLDENAPISYYILDEVGNSLVVAEKNFYRDSITFVFPIEGREVIQDFHVSGLDPFYLTYLLYPNDGIFTQDEGIYTVYLNFLSVPKTDTLRVHYRKIPTVYGYEIENTAAYLNGDTVSSTTKNLINIVR